jgi:hypothetical protein
LPRMCGLRSFFLFTLFSLPFTVTKNVCHLHHFSFISFCPSNCCLFSFLFLLLMGHWPSQFACDRKSVHDRKSRNNPCQQPTIVFVVDKVTSFDWLCFWDFECDHTSISLSISPHWSTIADLSSSHLFSFLTSWRNGHHVSANSVPVLFDHNPSRHLLWDPQKSGEVQWRWRKEDRSECWCGGGIAETRKGGKDGVCVCMVVRYLLLPCRHFAMYSCHDASTFAVIKFTFLAILLSALF